MNKDNITEVFMSYFVTDVNPRLRALMQSLVGHLHSFIKEVNLTHEEWEKGINILERSGEISDSERHEFVLLSDVLGISYLVYMHNSCLLKTSQSPRDRLLYRKPSSA